MTNPERTEKHSNTCEVRARKGLFKSEKRSVSFHAVMEACQHCKRYQESDYKKMRVRCK